MGDTNKKFWLASYPADVPAEIDPGEYASLRDLAESACKRHADRPAFIQMGRTMTYRELDVLSRGFAAWLQKTGGARKGDRIAIMMPNLLQYPVALLGALRAGLTVVNTNPLYTAPELEHQLKDSGAQTIVILENFAHVLQQVIARTNVKQVLVTAVGDFLGFPKSWIVNYVVRRRRKQVPAWRIEGALDFRSAVFSGRGMALDPVDVGHEDIAFLQYTGGTTGVAKGAMLTHRNMVANVLQGRAWFAGGLTPESTYVIALPLYHIFSLTANLLLFMTIGARGLLIVNPRDFPSFLKELATHRPHFFMGVNTLFNALMDTPGFDAVDWSQLKGTIGGGMAVQRAVAERWKKRTGDVLRQGWGLTETSPIATMNPMDIPEFNGSIGLPVSSTEITVRDDEGRELPVGELGEICVRGPQVMRGYWNRPDETAKVMLPDGSVRTGDIGRIDERGFVYIEDRKKDMILVSGFNVYPNEVESVAVNHPGILEAAAIAQPDERRGETVALFVVRKDPTLTEETVIEHMRKSLTGYKVPKSVYFRKELPKTNVGKILRRALRDELPDNKKRQGTELS